LNAARKTIAGAEVVYILGYGFDESNNRRLNLSQTFARMSDARTVLFTNYGDLARVSKAASRLMFGSPEKFVDQKVHQTVRVINGVRTPFAWEMSSKNCYEALAEDFESLEE